jgi:uncharacterized protein
MNPLLFACPRSKQGRHIPMKWIVLLTVLIGMGFAAPVRLFYQRVERHQCNTALVAAVRRGDVTTVKILLAQGADPNAREQVSQNRSLWQMLRQMILRRSSPPRRSSPVLIMALTAGTRHTSADFLSIAVALLNAGANVDAKDERTGTPAIKIAGLCPDNNQFWPNQQFLRLLLEHGADANAVEKDGWPLLMYAAGEGKLEIVKLLLKHGAQVNSQDAFRTTPLMLAAEGKHSEVVRLLLQCHADPNLQMFNGYTALGFAKGLEGDKGSPSVVRLLERQHRINLVALHQRNMLSGR